jgi:hypothetical protein
MKIKKSSLLVCSSIHCGHFEPILNKFGSYLPKLIGLAHDICPKMVFGIFQSKIIQNQKKFFW